MSGTDFGDWEPADSFVADNVPDPEYVARRLHEVRQYLEIRAGSDVEVGWDSLSDGERLVAVALGTVLLRHLLTRGRDGSAVALAEAQEYFATGRSWRELDRDEQSVALAITDDIVRWLVIEGTKIGGEVV